LTSPPPAALVPLCGEDYETLGLSGAALRHVLVTVFY